ncbi:CDP-alcohol phosphatidyltransferase family protein [Alkaliphilus crotonatoxidans]
MNIPNILTAIRFALIPIFILIFFSASSNYVIYGLIIFLLAGATDMLDGYIARKYNLITKWGQAMDPLADKLMLITVLISFTIKGLFPPWVILIVGLKETMLVMGGIFLYTRKNKAVLPANHYGKIATVLFYIVVIWVALGLPLARPLTIFAVAFTAGAFINYFILGLKIVKNQASMENEPEKLS